MKVLLFGGSFDPPHRGHLRLLESALARLRPDKTFLVPAGQSPLKSPARAAAAERLALCRAFVSLLPGKLRRGVKISDWEIRRAGPSYTYAALRMFAKKFPKAELYFLLGSDAAGDFPRWRNTGEIRKRARFVLGRRPGASWPGPQARLPETLRLAGTFPEFSSTNLRAELLCGRDENLAPALKKIVRKKRLYGGKMRALLKRVLSPQRYEHSLAVADMARELAGRHGLNAEKAALAGLLHDLGRSIPIHLLPAYLRRRKIRFPALEATARRNPMLMHAHASEDLARTLLGIKDEEVLSAVRKHTLGDARMSPLDRLLFAADACSLDRTYAGAKRVRRKARRSVEKGFRAAAKNKLDDVKERGAWKHPNLRALKKLLRGKS